MLLSANCKPQNISHAHLACLLLLIVNLEIYPTLIQNHQPSVCLVPDAINNFIYQTSTRLHLYLYLYLYLYYL
jgi:hypothetical protein